MVAHRNDCEFEICGYCRKRLVIHNSELHNGYWFHTNCWPKYLEMVNREKRKKRERLDNEYKLALIAHKIQSRGY